MIELKDYSEENFNEYYTLFCSIVAEKIYFSMEKPFPAESSRQFRQDQMDNNYPMVVAIDNGTLVGWCDIFGNGDECSPKLGIGIAKDYRNQGLGAKLITTALNKCKERNLTAIYLDAFADNTRALSLYKRLGFVHLPEYDKHHLHCEEEKLTETYKIEL